ETSGESTWVITPIDPGASIEGPVRPTPANTIAVSPQRANSPTPNSMYRRIGRGFPVRSHGIVGSGSSATAAAPRAAPRAVRAMGTPTGTVAGLITIGVALRVSSRGWRSFHPGPPSSSAAPGDGAAGAGAGMAAGVAARGVDGAAGAAGLPAGGSTGRISG